MNRRKLARRTAHAAALTEKWKWSRILGMTIRRTRPLFGNRVFTNVPTLAYFVNRDGIHEYPGGRVISDCIQNA